MCLSKRSILPSLCLNNNRNLGQEIYFTKYLFHQPPEVTYFVVIDAYKDHPVVPQ